ncbi:MAG: 50S ribosomal protein L13 [Minisyncoccales bacterium]
MAEKKIYTLDAHGKTLGRLASQISVFLLGKREKDFEPQKDPNVFVVVKNLDGLKFSGKKLEKKKYFFHSKYLGHSKEISLRDLWKKDPEKVLKMAVYGMLRKNRLRKKIIQRLKIEK